MNRLSKALHCTSVGVRQSMPAFATAAREVPERIEFLE